MSSLEFEPGMAPLSDALNLRHRGDWYWQIQLNYTVMRENINN